jgi:hypothetical protein
MQTTSRHQQQADQDHTETRDNVEAPRYVNVPVQNPVVAPPQPARAPVESQLDKSGK